MTSHNDITGDKIQTKVTTEEYRDNYDKIFSKEDYDEYDKTIENLLQVDIPCCGGSTSCTAPCVADKCKEEKTNG